MEFFGFTFVMFIGAAVALLGFLILLFTAFTTSAAWGLGSLVVPPVTLAFAVSHWSKAKNGFAILMIGVIIFAYGSYDKSQSIKQPPATQAVDNSASSPSDNSATPVAPTAPAQAPAATASPSPSQPTATSAPPTAAPQQDSGSNSTKLKLINIIDAQKYLNSEVRVTTDDGVVRIGTLIDNNDQGLILDSIVDGATGRVRLTIPEDKIHLIELLPQ